MATAATDSAAKAPAAVPKGIARQALYLMLGFSAGLPFSMFSTVLSLRLQAHEVALVVIGFFAWVQLLPTFKFLWAPILDRYEVPGFGRFWGKRRGWIMLSQLGIFTSLAAMGLLSSDQNLALTALFAVLLAFWTTTLEVAADAWRIELAPTQEEQGPLAAANLWGYRSAMVAAGSGALAIADLPGWGWTGAYLAIAAAAFLPFPMLASMRPDPNRGGSRAAALAAGLVASILILAGLAAVAGGRRLAAARRRVRRRDERRDQRHALRPCDLHAALRDHGGGAAADSSDAAQRAGPPLGRDRALCRLLLALRLFALALMAFVSIYRMGDVLALNLSKPMIRGLGYSLTDIARADTVVALGASIVGVGLGGLMAARWPLARTLAIGAVFARSEISPSSGSPTSRRRPLRSTSRPRPTSSATEWPARSSSSTSRCWSIRASRARNMPSSPASPSCSPACSRAREGRSSRRSTRRAITASTSSSSCRDS
jgi:PAT family beta-lactamase induction signal transducer AmpG